MIENEAQLEDLLSAPNENDLATMRRLPGDIIILGAGGKMGPSLAHRIKRAAEAVDVERRVIAVSRFSSSLAREALEQTGIETISCDLLDSAEVNALPECENVLYLAGRKFGSTDRTDLTWASNTVVPTWVADHFRRSRIIVFSTGNVYPFVTAVSGGSVEPDLPEPRGEYAQSCLGRERVFEYFSRKYGTPCLIFRLNYAVDLRYGVLVDIARKVYAGEPVDLTVAAFNVIWQGDANSYALRCLEWCESPPRILNVTGPEIVSVRQAAEFFARKFNREAAFQGEESETALLNNASLCHRLLGNPEVTLGELMEMVAHWVEIGGASLNKPTKFEVLDGRF
ncbi:MAG: NAD-dependent epimerase/dehydratase family protein [Acidobacteria bacterium]|nr:NAD-dependent epimerase/dehydratase family protein [Acidobacteriota bacterium]